MFHYFLEQIYKKKTIFRILRAATAGIVSRHETRYKRGMFDMKQIKDDAKEETEVFQQSFFKNLLDLEKCHPRYLLISSRDCKSLSDKVFHNTLCKSVFYTCRMCKMCKMCESSKSFENFF